MIITSVLCALRCVCAYAGNALEFERAESQYAAIPLTLPDTGTIELWHKTASFYDFNTIFDNSTDANDWELWIYASGELRFRIQDGDLRYDLSELGGTNQWYHIAVTWEKRDSSKVDYTLWVNGTLRGSVTNENWVAPGDTFYLAGGHIDNDAGEGQMDDVRIWSDVRTESEISKYMHYELVGDEEGLLAYFPMNQTGTTNLDDSASGNYDGILVNMSESNVWVDSSAPVADEPYPVIDITNVNETVHTEVTTYTVGGVNNQGVVGALSWTNAANGAHGTIPSAPQWKISEILLKLNENTITVSGTNSTGQVVSDSVTITQANLNQPDVGNMQTLDICDVRLDLAFRMDICSVLDSDPPLMVVVFQGYGSAAGGDVRLRIISLDEENQMELTGPSILLQDEVPGKHLSFPQIIPLENQHVLVTWAEIEKNQGPDATEIYIIKGLIYNVETQTAGEVTDLSEEFEVGSFYGYTMGRAGFSGDGKLLISYNYRIREDSIDHYRIKGQLLTYNGLELGHVGEPISMIPDPSWEEVDGHQIYSFPETDLFISLFGLNYEPSRIKCQVFQLDEAEPNGFRSVSYETFYTGEEFEINQISVSGVHGDAVESRSKVLITFRNPLDDEYSIMAHLSDENVLIHDSFVSFDPSIKEIYRGESAFVENREYAWVISEKQYSAEDLNYNLLDLSVDPPTPFYPNPLIPRAENDKFENEFRVLARPNGDAVFLVGGYVKTTDEDFLRVHYLPVPTVSLTSNDADGGEYGDTNLTFALTRSGGENGVLGVDYAISGTASNGADFSQLDGRTGFAVDADTSAVAIDVWPDNQAEGDETLTLQLLPGIGYKIISPSNATVTLHDRPMHEYLFQQIGTGPLSAPDQDADGDGVLNMDEYYMMTSPTNNADHSGFTTAWDGHFKIRYPRGKNRDDVTVTIMWCRDLCANEWHTSDESDGTITVSITEAILSDPADDPETVELRVETTSGPQPDNLYIRVYFQ